MHLLHILIERKLERLEAAANMGRVTKRLLLGHATGAPIVVFGTKDHILDLIRSDFGLHRERLLTNVALESTLEIVTSELLDGYTLVACQIWVQESLQVLIPFFLDQARRLIDRVQVLIIVGALKLTDLLLQLVAGWHLWFNFILEKWGSLTLI